MIEAIGNWLSTPADNGSILAAVVALTLLTGWKNSK